MRLRGECAVCGWSFTFDADYPVTIRCQKKGCGASAFKVSVFGLEPSDSECKTEMETGGNCARISVVVVCHNLLEITKECIHRLRASNLRPYEIILVDNGSSDGTRDWALTQPDLVYVRNEVNLGCAMGRNVGAKRATGEWLLFFDNDQYVEPKTIRVLFSKLVQGADIVGSELWYISIDGGAMPCSSKRNKSFYVGSGGMILRRETFESLNGYDEGYAPAWYADTDFIFRAKEKGYLVDHEPNTGIRHLKNSTVTTQTTFDSNEAKKNSMKRFVERWTTKLEAGAEKLSVSMLVSRSEGLFHRAMKSIVTYQHPDEINLYVAPDVRWNVKYEAQRYSDYSKIVVREQSFDDLPIDSSMFSEIPEEMLLRYWQHTRDLTIRAITEASHEWVRMCDDDDEMRHDVRPYLIGAPKDVATIHGDVFEVDHVLYGRSYHRNGSDMTANPIGSTNVFRKSAIQKASEYWCIGPWPDWRLSYALRWLGYRSQYQQETFSVVHLHGKNSSRKPKPVVVPKWPTIEGRLKGRLQELANARRKLKITVCEWNIARISGRMSTMVRFADAFKRLGHDVILHSCFYPEDIRSEEDVLRMHDAKYLTDEDVRLTLKRIYGEAPEEWRGRDLIFASWVVAQRAVEAKGAPPVISWTISPTGTALGPVKEYWTNTETKCRELKCDRWIFPPYSYEMFREAAKPLSERKYDICYATRTNTAEKRVEEFLRVVKDNNLKGAICAIGGNKHIEQSGVDYWIDVPKSQVAEMMGNSKIYFHPSIYESASVAIYEALNAGCWPVAYETGAIREQVGNFGTVYQRDPDQIIVQKLKEGWDMGEVVEWGRKYDVDSNIDKLNNWLVQLAKNL